MLFRSTPSEHTQGYITKATIYKDKIITLDEMQSKKANVYNINGDFLYTVCEIGRGPKEAISIKDFSVLNDTIYITDPIKKEVLIFSLLDGEFIGNKKLPFGALEFHKLADNEFLFVLNDYNDITQDYLTNTCLITDSLFNPISFFNAPSPTDISTLPYTLSLHDALPICYLF